MSAARITALFVYPIKSCAGILVDTMRFDECGPIDDRRWMVVDTHGVFLTQRELPRLCWVRPARIDGGLRVLAPGMPALQVAGHGGPSREVWCWDHRCQGFDEGPQVAQWFSEYLGQAVRLVRFDTAVPRSVTPNWLDGPARMTPVLTRFTDGFPLTIMARPSLDALNADLTQAGLPSLAVQHFRPNVVIDGLAPFAEDQIKFVRTADAHATPVSLNLVKPGTCDATLEIDLQQGRLVPGVLQYLTRLRAHPALGGAPVFGWNAILNEGRDGILRRGDDLVCQERAPHV